MRCCKPKRVCRLKKVFDKKHKRRCRPSEMRPDKIKFRDKARANKRRTPKRSKTRNFYFLQINFPSRFFRLSQTEKIFPANDKKREACRAADNLRAEIFRKRGRIWKSRARYSRRKPNKSANARWKNRRVASRFFRLSFSVFRFPFICACLCLRFYAKR